MDVSLTLLSGKQNIIALRHEWEQLFASNGSESFFLSWAWIGNWLNQQIHPIYLLKACKGIDTKGLALFTLSITKSGIKQLRLHKSGSEELDQIWIEYNDFLLAKEDSQQIRALMLDYLVNQQSFMWEELYVDMSITADLYHHEKLLKRTTLESTGYRSSFGLLNHNDVFDLFSKNTKQQLKRSKKLLQAEGELQLIIDSRRDAKYASFNKLALLHKEQWQNTEWGSGFNNKKFVEFHQQLIASQDTLIIRLVLSGKTLAYGYYLCCNGVANFYLSAVDKAKDNKVKTGLVLHWFAMEYFLKEGFHSYDFLAGDYRYKKSLSNTRYGMNSICLYRPHIKLQIFQAIRRLKNKFRSRVK